MRLKAGLNTLVVEITNGLGDCGFYLRLEHEDGTAAVIDDDVADSPLAARPR